MCDEKEDPRGLDWDEIKSVLDRLTSIQDYMRQAKISLPSSAAATLISAMQLHLVEVGGNYCKAHTLMAEFMHNLWGSVHGMLKSALTAAAESGEVMGSAVGKAGAVRIKELLADLEQFLVSPHTIDADEIVELLTAQKELSAIVIKGSEGHAPLAVARALVVMAQQFMLFDLGDELSAKSAFEDQSRLLWGVAIANAKNLLKQEEADELSAGVAATAVVSDDDLN